MKKTLLFIIPLLLLGACEHEQKTYIVGETAFCKGLEDDDREPVYCVDEKDRPINGMVIEYYASGKIHRELTLRRGRENGIEKEYYENGNLHVETNVVNGESQGLSRIYHENGNLHMEMNWVGKSATDFKMYDEQGKQLSLVD